MIKIVFDKSKFKHSDSKLNQFFKRFFAKFKSVKNQFVVPVLLLLALGLIAAEGFSFVSSIISNRSELKIKAEALSSLATLSLANPLWDYNDEGVKTSGMALFEDKEVSLVEITDNSDKVIFANKKTHKGYSDIIVTKKILKDDKVAGSLKLGLTDFYRTNQLKSNLFTFFIKLFLLCLILWVTINLIAQKIVEPIQAINQIVNKMADGDFTADLAIDAQNEVGMMAKELHKMEENLSVLVAKVLDSAERVSIGSREIASGNQDLSQRTQEQAATLQEISATVEVITKSILQTAANSSQADQISQTTLETVQQGELVIEETMDAMKQITISSSEIGEIIQVVNDIAFQTNLLALNAAVEAARAGEQGRGFAVVAAEVRNLAGRTAESSKEIQKLIKESMERVEKGNVLVSQSSEMLRQIVRNTQRTSEVVTEITTALKEQSASAEQIQIALEQLNQVTQQNAAMVQELSAAGASLNYQAENLSTMVSVFKIKNNYLKKFNSEKQDNTDDYQVYASKVFAKDQAKTLSDFKDDDLAQF